MTTNGIAGSHGAVARGLIVAALLLGVTTFLTLMSPEYLTPAFVRRALGVLLGAVVVLYANAVPKALTPLVRMHCDPAAEQAIRRFTGWALVLGGLMYSLTWMIAPLEYATLLSAGILGTALLLAVARVSRGVAAGTGRPE